MTPERYQQIRASFESIVSLSDSGLALSALEALRVQDSDLASEVDELLAVHDSNRSFVEIPTAVFSEKPFLERYGEAAGTTIGPYELIEVVGQGGMGQVWRAQQTRPVRRTVALKLIKAGMDTQEVVRRFETERQALAVMDHPVIAKVFDAGSTPGGRPYFVMEYVEGTPIHTYCDQHRLTVCERLRLFIRVCEGIQHAHQKAIIHRDIKPSNVLVTEVDGLPSPRIIDFGVARAISAKGSGDTTLTRMGAVLGTPAYMSPEQASTDGSDLDTRADVYSLGVLLYELLVGVVPHDSTGLPLAEVLRKIREEPAVRPSVRFRTSGLDWKVASNRRTTPADLVVELRGDLDIVLLKALKRNPASRYAAAADLAADIQRYLAFEPILARPASLTYLTRRYIRRHWPSVIAASSLLVLLVAFAIWQSIQVQRVTRERDRADRVAQFMTDMFEVSDPSANRGSQMTLREILDRSSRGIQTGLRNDPELQAKLMSVMGRVYMGLGVYAQAESLFRHALDIRQRLTGKDSLATAQSMYDLAMAVRSRGNPAAAQSLDRAALGIRSSRLGNDHPETLRSMSGVSADLERQGLYAEARKLEESVYQAERRILGPEHGDTVAAMENLGGLLYTEGRLGEAEIYARKVLRIHRITLGSDHPDTLESIHLLGDVLFDEGRYPGSEELFRELLQTRTRVLGAEHPDTLRAAKALAVCLNWQGRLAEAELLERQVVRDQERLVGPADPTSLAAESDLAHILADEGKYNEAVRIGRQVVETSARVLGDENARTLFWASGLASILLQKGALDEAEALAIRTQRSQMRVLGKDHVQTARTTYTLARIQAREGKTTEAIALLRNAVDHGLTPSYALRIDGEPSFKSIRSLASFHSIVETVRRRTMPGSARSALP